MYYLEVMNHASFDFDSPGTKKLVNRLRNPLLFKLYCLNKLPMAWFAGLAVEGISPEEIKIKLPYRWSTKNPFRSVYFAAQTAAAEMSTGLAVLLPVQHAGNISMLVTNTEANFMRKATSDLVFVCTEVPKAWKLVEKAIDTNAGQKALLRSEGIDKEGNVVSEFFFEWSVKVKSG